jgi:hypothetical protein
MRWAAFPAVFLCGCAAVVVTPTPKTAALTGVADLHVHLTLHAGLPFIGDASLQRLARSGEDPLNSQLTDEGCCSSGKMTG